MLLVHKQPNHSALLPAVHISHRRNPSAPSLLAVHPTRTPGLLSLSKPRESTRPAARHSRHNQRAQAQGHPQSDDDNKDRQPAKRPDASQPSTTTPAADPAPSPEKPRGRHRSTHRPAPAKQPIAPRSKSTAAEPAAPAHLSDTDAPPPPAKQHTSPRKQRPQQQRTNTAPPSPVTAIGPPSGRLARNRRARHKTSASEVITLPLADLSAPAPAPAASGAVPVPAPKIAPARAHPTLSRSAPLTVPSRKGGKVRGLSDWDMPPEDDDEADDDETQLIDATWPRSSGLRTAPLTTAASSDPFLSSPPLRPRHTRAPSVPAGAIFALDDDDDAVPFPRTPPRVQATRARYAGSAFQNAPNPSELPLPKVLATP